MFPRDGKDGPPGPGDRTLDTDRETIYLDHAATSFPKAPGVAGAVAACLDGGAFNPGRSGYDLARAAAGRVDDLRRRLDRFFNNPAGDPARCVFTANATDALNLALAGLCRPGDHVVTTAVEHNSVLRPLHMLQERGAITTTVVPCDGRGRVDPDAVAEALGPATRLVVLNHASNVCGAIQPVADIAAACRERGVLLLLDVAQTAGVLPVDMTALGADLLAFTGHKGLLGPTGTGGLLAGPGVEVASSRWGGTGVRSEELHHPDAWPYRLEAGTVNVAGLAGLAAALDWLEDKGVEEVARHERALADRFLAGIREIPGLRLVGRADADAGAPEPDRLAVVALNLAGRAPHELGEFLDVDFGIAVRTGLHCAPLLHRALGTAPAGAVRFSFGPFNTPAHVDAAVAALATLAPR